MHSARDKIDLLGTDRICRVLTENALHDAEYFFLDDAAFRSTTEVVLRVVNPASLASHSLLKKSRTTAFARSPAATRATHYCIRATAPRQLTPCPAAARATAPRQLAPPPRGSSRHRIFSIPFDPPQLHLLHPLQLPPRGSSRHRRAAARAAASSPSPSGPSAARANLTFHRNDENFANACVRSHPGACVCWRR